MRRGLVLVVLAMLAACATERVVLGTIGDPPDADVVSSDAAGDAGDAGDGGNRCPEIARARTFESAEKLQAVLEGYWRICSGTTLWDAPLETIGIAIIAGNAYLVAPGAAGQSILDPASRRRLDVLSVTVGLATESGVVEYGAGTQISTVEVTVATDGNALVLHDRGAGGTVAFVRTSSSFR